MLSIVRLLNVATPATAFTEFVPESVPMEGFVPIASVTALVKLGVTMFSLKVTSTPSGATITIAGKSAGVTPTTVKVPSGVSTITLSKPGYAPDTEKVTAKANGQSHHVTLKKGGRH